MSVRRAIAEVSLDGLNVAEFCRQHGISRWLFYELRRRFEAEGAAGLEPRSRAPRRVANKTPADVEDLIVATRKRLSERGWDAGPASIVDALAGVEGVPSEATIWRILTLRGFVVAEPRKAPRSSVRRFNAERANECWQIDDFSWPLADGRDVKVISIVDDCTRLSVALRAAASCDGAEAVEAFLGAGGRWGLPARLLSDNAKAFRFTLAEAAAPLGVRSGHSRPHHPQTCGKVERLHQTVQRFLAARPPAETLNDLQQLLDEFQQHYNEHRAHRSIGRRTPLEVWKATPKDGPADQPIGATTRVHRGTVAANGTFSITNRVISVGNAHAGRHATTIVTGLAAHVFIDGRLVRALTIDPAKRRQPLHPRRGRPSLRDVARL